MKRLAIFVSGRGSNFEAIDDAIHARRLKAGIALLVSNQAEAKALETARRRKIQTLCLPSKGVDTDAWAEQARLALEPYKIDLICLAGFMRRVGKPLLEAYPQRILNIHPSLLPSFPGLDVQQQALDYGVKYSGCTVHFVEQGVDTGPIVAQAAVAVEDDDTAETLAARILKEEHKLYSQAIAQVLSHGYEIEGRRVVKKEPEAEAEGEAGAGKQTIEQLLEKCEKDTRSYLGFSAAAVLSTWRQMAAYSQPDLLRFLKEWLRRSDATRIRLMDREGGLSVERIVLDHHPGLFSPEDQRVAKKSLGL